MATITFQDGAVKQNTGLLADYSNAYPPFQKNGGLISKRFYQAAPTGDQAKYASGDDIVVEVHQATEIEFAVGVSEAGAIKAYTKADLTAPSFGKKITFANVTTDELQVLIAYRV